MTEWRVPFINYPRAYQAHKAELNDAIFGCLERGDLVFREDLISFERNFAKFCGVNHGIGVGSCSNAMYLCLKLINVFFQEVITVSHTYIATIDAIVHAGGTPVLVDIDYDTMNMDVDLLEKAITPQTKAIIPVHLNGRMCEMDRIMEIAKKHNLYVIEDAAQAAGAEYLGKKAGAWGDFGCFSFYPAKVLGCFGEGGMIVTNDEGRASDLYLMRDHGEWPRYLPGGTKGEIYGWGYNSILDNIQAAVLNAKLRHLPEAIERRRKIAEMYSWELPGPPFIYTPMGTSERFSIREGFQDDVFQNYVIRIEQRDALREHLTSKGIGTLVSWPTPNHRQNGLPDLHRFNLSVTERISREVLSLPMYPELTDEEVAYVVKAARLYFS